MFFQQAKLHTPMKKRVKRSCYFDRPQELNDFRNETIGKLCAQDYK
jgi:hypothetical protein